MPLPYISLAQYARLVRLFVFPFFVLFVTKLYGSFTSNYWSDKSATRPPVTVNTLAKSGTSIQADARLIEANWIIWGELDYLSVGLSVSVNEIFREIRTSICKNIIESTGRNCWEINSWGSFEPLLADRLRIIYLGTRGLNESNWNCNLTSCKVSEFIIIVFY